MIFTFDSKKQSKTDNHLSSRKRPPPSFDSTGALSAPSAFRVLEDDGFTSFKQTKRSKRGCLTCKIRKKKCDETTPVCSDCSRLGKRCVYIDYDNMHPSEIKSLKEMVEKSESTLKLRKRKKPSQDQGSPGRKWVRTDVEYTPLITAESPMANFSSPNSPNIINLLNNEIEEIMPKPKQKVEPEQKESSDSPDDALCVEEMGGVHYVDKLVKYSATSPSSSQQNSPFITSYDMISFLKETVPDFSFGKSSPLEIPSAPASPLAAFANLDFSQMISTLNHPSPRMTPTVLSDLSSRANYLYDYYVHVICPKISVAPTSAKHGDNQYERVFLPLAQNDIGVMYSILSWACFALGREDDIKEGMEYIRLAINHFFSNKSTERAMVVNKLALLLIVLGAEICRGDVKNWTRYMDWGSNLLHQIGGLGSFNKSKEEIWLISNFAYHDVLSSNKADRGLYFSGEQYDRIFSHDLSNGIMHPLVGIAKDIYICIGMISTLVFETNQKLMTLNNELNEKNVSDSPKTEVGIGTSDINKFEEESDLSNHAKVNEILLSVKASAMELDAKIEAAKPNSEDLINLTDQEFEWQITLFETFKLSAKLYLRQAILRCNPSSLESQILTNDLVKCLDIILGSPVQTVLSFPVFMAGIHCVTVLDRQFMTARIEQYIRTYGPWSLTRVRAVIEKIWEFNPKGDTVVDWHGVLKEFGWEINFA